MSIRGKIGQMKSRFGGQPTGFRKGRGLRDATQRMRNLRAQSPIASQIGHPIKFPRPKLGQQMAIPKPFGGKIWYKITYLYGRVRSKIPIPKLLSR